MARGDRVEHVSRQTSSALTRPHPNKIIEIGDCPILPNVRAPRRTTSDMARSVRGGFGRVRVSYDPEVDAAYIYLTVKSLMPGERSMSA